MSTRHLDHPLEALLAPELFLPTQLPPARRDSAISGERALMLAVLEDAIRCLEARPGSELAREAETWIRADDPAWPFSFVCICDALGFDADRLRAALLARRAAAAPEDAADDAAPVRRYRLHLRLKPPTARIRARGREPDALVPRDVPKAALG